jgi:excisionase family DNA binding protein
MKKISAPAKPTPALADEIMTVPTLALYLRCSQATIYRLVKERKIPAFKLGTDWRFFLSDIDEWIAGRRVIIPPVTTDRKPKVS